MAHRRSPAARSRQRPGSVSRGAARPRRRQAAPCRMVSPGFAATGRGLPVPLRWTGLYTASPQAARGGFRNSAMFHGPAATASATGPRADQCKQCGLDVSAHRLLLFSLRVYNGLQSARILHLGNAARSCLRPLLSICVLFRSRSFSFFRFLRTSMEAFVIGLSLSLSVSNCVRPASCFTPSSVMLSSSKLRVVSFVRPARFFKPASLIRVCQRSRNSKSAMSLTIGQSFIVDNGFADFQPLQSLGRLQVGEAGSGDRGAAENESRQMRHSGEVGQAVVGHGVAAEEVQLLHVLALQRRQAGIRDNAVFDGQDLQFLHAGQGLHALIGHRGAANLEVLHVWQLRHGRESDVGDLRAAEVDGPQLLHRGKLGNARVADPVVEELEVLQLRHLGQVGHGLVGHAVRVAEIQNAESREVWKVP